MEHRLKLTEESESNQETMKQTTYGSESRTTTNGTTPTGRRTGTHVESSGEPPFSVT